MAKRTVFSMLVILATALSAQAAKIDLDTMTFKDVEMLDFSEMDRLVRQVMGRNTLDDVEREPKVRAALKLVLSKRNNDGKRTPLFLSLQGQLPEPFFLLSLQKLAEGAIATIKDTNVSQPQRATAFLVLENMIAEMKPRSQDYSGIFTVIRDSKIEVDPTLRSYRRLQGMDLNNSPSELAQEILERNERQAKEAQQQLDDKLVAKTPAPDFE